MALRVMRDVVAGRNTMRKLSLIFSSPTVIQEKEFQRSQIAAKRDWYFRTNPLNRIQFDPAYKHKIDLIKRHLGSPKGVILDIGGNVAGEAIVLQQSGLNFLVGDINEIALGNTIFRSSEICSLRRINRHSLF